MTDEQENKTQETLVQEKPEANPAQVQTEAASGQEQVKEEPKEDPNWKAFREARKKDKMERDAALKKAQEKEAEAAALKAAMEAAFTKQQPVRYEHNQFEIQEESEDQRLEKKINEMFAAREAAYEKSRIEREKNELPQRLMQAYPDYNQVVNEENGAYLEYHYPELYRSILRQPENFETLSDVYKLIKKFVPNSTTAKKEAAKADANFNKPKSMSTTGLTQTQQNRMSPMELEKRRATRYEEMKRIMNQVG